MVSNKFLIVICGPTASGKTALAIQVAQHFNTVVLSADSRQFYREMNIGTAKPTTEELAAVPHHFIDSLSVADNYSAGDFERDALKLLDQLFLQHEVVAMAGGSGLFIKAVCEGLNSYPEVSEEIRNSLIQELKNNGLEPLQQELKTADPKYFATVDQQNPHRILRALEVCRASGKTFSEFQQQEKKERHFNPLFVALDWDRKVLYDRINQRVDEMMEEGLLAEVKSLSEFQKLNSLQSVGYKELFSYLNGHETLETAVTLIKRNTRRYAKRQLTWFRKEKALQWFAVTNKGNVVPWIEQQMTDKDRLDD